MTGIGPDIAEVLNELGTLINIIKHDGSATVQEYMDYEIKIEANSPFLTQFIIDVTLTHNTTVVPGDIIQIVDDSSYYILVVLNKTRFEDSVVTCEGVIYKCNMVGSFSRLTTERDSTYELETTWTDYQTNEPVLLTGSIDNYDIIDRPYAQFAISQDNLHVSGDVAVQVGDRFTNAAGDAYEIKAVSLYRLNNVTMCRVVSDTRE